MHGCMRQQERRPGIAVTPEGLTWIKLAYTKPGLGNWWRADECRLDESVIIDRARSLLRRRPSAADVNELVQNLWIGRCMQSPDSLARLGQLNADDPHYRAYMADVESRSSIHASLFLPADPFWDKDLQTSGMAQLLATDWTRAMSREKRVGYDVVRVIFERDSRIVADDILPTMVLFGCAVDQRSDARYDTTLAEVLWFLREYHRTDFCFVIDTSCNGVEDDAVLETAANEYGFGARAPVARAERVRALGLPEDWNLTDVGGDRGEFLSRHQTLSIFGGGSRRSGRSARRRSRRRIGRRKLTRTNKRRL